MRKIALDIETISDIDLKKCGARVYAASPHTRITVLSFYDFETRKQYTIHDEAIALKKNNLSEEDKAVVNEVFCGTPLIIAHNASFESTVMLSKLAPFLRDNLDLYITNTQYRYFCTMTWANVFRSPASLVDACKFFDVEIQKDEKGQALMKKICSPMKENTTSGVVNGLNYQRVELKDSPFKGGWEVYERMRRYCIQDVQATVKLFGALNKRIKDLGDFVEPTKAGIALTEKMNNKGVKLDKSVISKLETARDTIFNKADESAAKAFGVPSASMGTRIKKAILEQFGMEVSSLGKKEIAKLIKSGKVKDNSLKEKLEDFAKYNLTSLRKVDKATSSNLDWRLYDLFKFAGAYATGRWSSFGMQLQNLPRSTQEDAEEAMQWLDKNADTDWVLETPERVVDGVRGSIVPDDKDHKFYITDLKGIEARMALYLSGYNDVVEKMHNEGLDVYIEAAAAAFGRDKAKERRQDGKINHLQAQYGASEVAIKNAIENGGGSITLEDSKKLKLGFRRLYTKMVTLWRKCDNQVKRAYIKKEPLRVTLNTGRVLDFGIPEMKEKKYADGSVRKNLNYYNGKKWIPIYGSKLFQNIVQAEARDLLLLKMIEMDKMGFDIRMTIHDEVVIQVKSDANKEELDAAWASAGAEEIEKYWKGLLVASDSVILNRYWSH